MVTINYSYFLYLPSIISMATALVDIVVDVGGQWWPHGLTIPIAPRLHESGAWEKGELTIFLMRKPRGFVDQSHTGQRRFSSFSHGSVMANFCWVAIFQVLVSWLNQDRDVLTNLRNMEIDMLILSSVLYLHEYIRRHCPHVKPLQEGPWPSRERIPDHLALGEDLTVARGQLWTSQRPDPRKGEQGSIPSNQTSKG